MADYLFWDLETHNAGKEYSMPREEFVRQMQYAWNDGPVETVYEIEHMRELLARADYIVGHNIINADLTWLYEADDLTPVKMALDKKVIDTFYLAHLLTPAPNRFKDREGHNWVLTGTKSPIGHTMKWLGLDNLCLQFGLEGKIGNLKELAKKHNPPKTKVADLDYGLIPLDDPEFVAYADQDVIAVRNLWDYLLKEIKSQDYPGHYIWREMALLAATVGQMSRNGILVNQEYVNGKLDAAEKKKAETMAWLVKEYDFPTEGKAPWSSAAGKEVILKVLADYGVTPETRPDWPRTPAGALKQGKDELADVTAGTDAEAFAEALGELKGLRSTAQQVADNLQPDGRVHPDITSLQRSGRWSFTEPGVTIFGERTEALREDKQMFCAAPGNVLAGFDYSNADARAMAALSGDPEYAKRFEVGPDGEELYDGHNLTGEAFFSADTYYGDGPRDKSARPPLRNAAKPGGHGQNYNLGAFKMAHMLNDVCRKENLDMHFWAPKHEKSKSPLPPIERREDSIDARDMISKFNDTYVWLKKFKDDAVKEAEDYGYVTNSWGRRMAVDKGREWTQAPALYGQSTTREIMGDAILALCRRGDYYIRAMRAIIHDELLMEFDADRIEEDIRVVKECMEQTFTPKNEAGVPLNFPVGFGYGKDWKQAAH